MHRVFENAATTDEIYMAIEAMTQDGVLDEKEAPRLRELVEKVLNGEIPDAKTQAAALRVWCMLQEGKLS